MLCELSKTSICIFMHKKTEDFLSRLFITGGRSRFNNTLNGNRPTGCALAHRLA